MSDQTPAQIKPPELPPVEVSQDGTAEQPVPAGQEHGPNNERLPEDLQAALVKLIETFELDSTTSRREEVRRIRKAREFWNAKQYIYWSERDAAWKQSSPTPTTSQNDDPPYEFVTNIYRAFGRSFIATVSQNVPAIKWWPQSAKQEEDVLTAREASDITSLIERNNNFGKKLIEEAFYLWTDGTVASYTRFVKDGEKFGYDEEPIMGSQDKQLSPDQHVCAGCGLAQPAMPDMPAPEMCPKCEAPMGPENFQPAVIAQEPVQTGTEKIPRGQEVISMIGKLALNLPAWAEDQADYPYLIWKVDAHKSKVRATYPHVQEKIMGGDEGANDSYERQARLALATSSNTAPSDERNQLVVVKRAWIRPWSFYALDDKKDVQALLNLFPNGCYVAVAGRTYCESRNESMDDHWRVCHALPGSGQSRDAVGHDLISIQERYNTLTNIEIETHEHGIPTTWVDSQVIDTDAWAKSQPRPGYKIPTRGRPGLPMAASFYTEETGKVSPQLTEHARDLMGPVAQFVTSLFPALFGGQLAGNDTASGYAMQRDQALGGIGLIYREMKQFHAETMMLAVECFRRNRTKDVEIAVAGKGAEFESKMIHLDQLKGSIYAYPEADDDFPTSWTQRKNQMTELLSSQNPNIVGMFANPAVIAAMSRVMGFGNDIPVPGADSRQKQYREIEQLLAAVPMQTPTVDPLTGAPAVVQQPSVPVDEILDNHAVEFQTCQEWSDSDAGQAARAENPQGYENVRLHAQQHLQLLQAQMAPPPQAPEGGSTSKGPPEPPAQMPVQ